MKLIKSLAVSFKEKYARWEEIDYEGPVAYAFGGGGGGGSEVVPTGPFGPQIPFVNRLFNEAGNLLDQGPPQFPDFSTVAGQTGDLTASQDAIRAFIAGQTGTNQGAIDAATGAVEGAGNNPVSGIANPLSGDLTSGLLQLLGSGGNPLATQGDQTLGGATGAINAATGGAQGPQQGVNTSGSPTLGPAGLDINSILQQNLTGQGLNPFISDTVDAATRSLTNNFQRNVIPSIGDAASQAGQAGGTRQGIAEGIAAGDLQQNIGDVTAQLFSRGFDQNVAAQQNALGQVGQAQGQQGQFDLATGGLNEQIRNSILGQALQGAGLAQQGAGTGASLGLEGLGTGTSQIGNLLQAGNAQGLQQLFGGLGLIPSLQGNQLSQLGALNQSGLQQQGFNQAQLDDMVNRFFFEQFAPYNALSQFQNFIGGSFGSSVGGNPNNFNFGGFFPQGGGGPGGIPIRPF